MTKSIIRIMTLLALGSSALVLIFGEEHDSDSLAWIQRFIADKAAGAAAAFIMVRLYRRWSKTDPLLMAHEKMCEESLETSNPMCHGNDSEE